MRGGREGTALFSVETQKKTAGGGSVRETYVKRPIPNTEQGKRRSENQELRFLTSTRGGGRRGGEGLRNKERRLQTGMKSEILQKSR